MAKKTLIVTFADETTQEVTTTLEDKLAFETTLRKNKSWGPLADNALKMHPFMAWNALRREGRTELTWEQFSSGPTAVIDVERPDDEPADEEPELEVEGLGKGGRPGRSTSSSSPSPSAPVPSPTNGDDKTLTT